MTVKASTFGFVECADLISDQKYGAALDSFKQAIGKLRESKGLPKRSEVALQLLQIATALEDTLDEAFGQEWATPGSDSEDEDNQASCSFCGKEQREVRKLIAGPSVHICDACVTLCSGIVAGEFTGDFGANTESNAPGDSAVGESLCGICMEPRDSDELIFLPHAAYLCATCLDSIQILRDNRSSK